MSLKQMSHKATCLTQCFVMNVREPVVVGRGYTRQYLITKLNVTWRCSCVLLWCPPTLEVAIVN